MAEQITCGFIRRQHFARRRFGKAVDLFKWPVEAIQYAIKLHAHLQRQRPTCAVIRRRGRPAGKSEIVRVKLRLKHIQHMRAKCLRSFHNIRLRRILLAVDRKTAGRAMHGNACFNKRVDEFRSGQKVALFRRKNVAARIAFFRLAHHVIKLARCAAAASTAATPNLLCIRIIAIASCATTFFIQSRLRRFDFLRRNRPGVAVAAFNGIHAHPPGIE